MLINISILFALMEICLSAKTGSSSPFSRSDREVQENHDNQSGAHQVVSTSGKQICIDDAGSIWTAQHLKKFLPLALACAALGVGVPAIFFCYFKLKSNPDECYATTSPSTAGVQLDSHRDLSQKIREGVCTNCGAAIREIDPSSKEGTSVDRGATATPSERSAGEAKKSLPSTSGGVVHVSKLRGETKGTCVDTGVAASKSEPSAAEENESLPSASGLVHLSKSTSGETEGTYVDTGVAAKKSEPSAGEGKKGSPSTPGHVVHLSKRSSDETEGTWVVVGTAATKSEPSAGERKKTLPSTPGVVHLSNTSSGETEGTCVDTGVAAKKSEPSAEEGKESSPSTPGHVVQLSKSSSGATEGASTKNSEPCPSAQSGQHKSQD